MNNTYNLFSLLAEARMPKDTLVVVNTDLSRYPVREQGVKDGCGPFDPPSAESDRDGRNHWHEGYVILMLDGPIRRRGIAGNILVNSSSGLATASPGYNHSDIRAACLMAAGINPFSPNLFTIKAFEGTTKVDGDAEATMVRICKEVFGR